jgi:cysteine synthase
MFDELFRLVAAKVHSSKDVRTRDIHSSLLADRSIRDILEITLPELEDISEILGIRKGSGKVLAVRLDKAYGIIGFKKPVMGSLILKRLIEAAKKDQYNKNWIDGGNVNSCLALAYFAEKFEGRAVYVMSRFFPDYVLQYIHDISKKSIQLIAAPDLGLGIERDFYQYLVQLVRTEPEFRNFQPLWHAKYSGEYTQFLGKELAATLKDCPDYIVTVVGAGSTLEGQAIPIKARFNGKSNIIVPEHAQSPLLSLNTPTRMAGDEVDGTEYPSNWFSRPPQGIPHYVIGPHYNEVNPLIKREVLRKVADVFLYDDDDWKRMSYHCYLSDFRIGNSSAANLVAAKSLADTGSTVLTFIYEPFRSIYQGHNVGTQIFTTAHEPRTQRVHHETDKRSP